jgi:hypothetical protein
LVRVEFAIKSAAELRVSMTVEAQNRKVRFLIVTGIVVDVVYLNRITALPAHTTGPI